MTRFVYPPEVVQYTSRRWKSFDNYERKLLANFDEIKGHLVDFDLTSILDIGCDLGGMDVLLAQTFDVKDVHLLDGDGTGEKLNRYNLQAPIPWYDVRIGKAFVQANTSANVHAHTKVSGISVNAIFSFKSWGHHYPIDVYLDVVNDCLVPGGIVLTDIRFKTDGAEKLEAVGLKRVTSIPDHSPKCDRVIFRKPQ